MDDARGAEPQAQVWGNGGRNLPEDVGQEAWGKTHGVPPLWGPTSEMEIQEQQESLLSYSDPGAGFHSFIHSLSKYLGSSPGAPTLWPPDAKSRLIGKHPDAGKE